MEKRFLIYRIQILVILLGISSLSFAQIYSIDKDWGGLTQYSSATVHQDSIYVFFSSVASPKKGSIKAMYPDGSNSKFQWSKYSEDPSVPPLSRFIEYASEDNVPESNQNNLSRGGYKVIVTRKSDLAQKTYYCWVMIDDVVITSLDVYNGCDFLEVITKTSPSANTLRTSNVFRYWDFKSDTIPTIIHPGKNKYGDEYFNSIVWHKSSSNNITLPSFFSLTLTISPAPLYESKYDIEITNPFGRVIRDTTLLQPAKATLADFTLYIDKDGKNSWEDGGNLPEGEAPLRLKFDTKSLNADSVFWQIINDVNLFKKGGDSILWTDGYSFPEGTEIIPNKKLVPGTFPVEHIALNTSFGCRDTMKIYVKVDSSLIKSDAIPNVFTPNHWGGNDYFIIKDIQNNVASIKSFKISILSRQGLLVYSYSGDPKEWKGWDGRMDGSKRDAPEGIYYFIIEAKGWDGRTFKSGPYKGFLYLYRGR